MKDPAVKNVTAFTGSGGLRLAQLRQHVSSPLTPLNQRKENVEAVAARLRTALAKYPGANIFLNPIQDLRGGGRQTEGGTQFTLRGDDYNELRIWGQRLEQALRDRPELTDVSSDQQNRGMQMTLNIDRATAARLGITMRNIDAALGLAFGQSQVSTIYQDRNQYRVVMEAAPEYWQSPSTLDSLFVISPVLRAQVPLSAIAKYETTLAPLQVNHQGTFAATTVSFNLAEGVAMSQAADVVRETWREIGVPSSIYASFEGTARIFQQGLENQPYLILAALLTVYIVLGILYESLVPPDHDPLHAALRGRGRPARAAPLQDGVLADRADRRDPAHRHREEERDPHDRLRARGRAAARTRLRARRSTRPRCCASGRS
jgi:multidrug efflux pump